MADYRYFVCSVGEQDKGYDEENFERCQKYNIHCMAYDTQHKGKFDSVAPPAIALLKYKDALVAYGEVTGTDTSEDAELGKWNWRINVKQWVWLDDTDHTRGVSKYGIQAHTIGGDQYATVKEIDAKWGATKVQEIKKNSWELCSKLENLLLANHNLILTGAPGTGKTYLAKHIAKCMGAECAFVQFHTSYGYTDFVEGVRPTPPDEQGHIGFRRQDGVFKAFCAQAIDAPDRPHVFIIDEINRGELSKIFGELFFCIDPGYRGKQGMVKTQYQNMIEDGNDPFAEGFYVPENVYILGTMNDIDRSVESMDFAMRRRFAWHEVKASDNTGMLNILKDPTDARKRMERLNKAIDKTDGLGSAYHVGAAYFLRLQHCSPEELWSDHLRGLLYEYLRGTRTADEDMERFEKAYYGTQG